jgi:hypothetical protein
MQTLRTAEEIRLRILTVEVKLEQINAGLDKERERPFFERRPNVCQFLHIEKRTWLAVLDELKWTLNE